MATWSEGFSKKLNPDFWEESDYATENFVGSKLSAQLIQETEEKFGYKLPSSYIALLETQNGGEPFYKYLPVEAWDGDHLELSAFFPLGAEKPYALSGKSGHDFWVKEWGYPERGLIIAETPAGPHALIMLDYSACGPTGEPCVIRVDQESEFEILVLAKDFESFIAALIDEEEDEDDFIEDDEDDDIDDYGFNDDENDEDDDDDE